MMKYLSIKFLWIGLIAGSFCLSLIRIGYTEEQQSRNPHEGKYELVMPSQPTSTPDKVEIVELFWYVCPHCYQFEKYLKKTGWLKNKPDYVEFIQMPAVFENDRWIPLAKAYYTAEALDVLDKVHTPLFKAIHDQKREMNTITAIQNLFLKHGVSKEDFTKTYNSFAIETKIGRAQEMTERYGINGVPVVIVNGKYRLTSEKAEGYENMMLIIDYLIEKEHYIMQANRQATQTSTTQ